MVREGLNLPPGLRQTVKALFSIRCKVLAQGSFLESIGAPVGEAEAGSAGAQPAKE